MAFSEDSGGFAFACEDAKLSIGSSTWNTRLSQLARMSGPLYVVTRLLPDVDYISRIVSKRPSNIFILAGTQALPEATQLKAQFPGIRIALHPEINAKAVLLGPETVWIGSADFGKSAWIEVAIGLHSKTAYDKALKSLLEPGWAKAKEI